jgi:DNA polymerase III alpha subunit (gram-positive type)
MIIQTMEIVLEFEGRGYEIFPISISKSLAKD